MGFPLSRFQMLAGLCSQDEYARKALAPFKLFCIVLHDPDDKKFSGWMQRHFIDLHARTGDNLLFITFINPPTAWTPPDGLSFPEMERRALSGERGFDSWLLINHFLPAVAPDAELPCLLVTHDLLSREYLVLESSQDQIETQLLELGRLSSSLEGVVAVSDERVLACASRLGGCQLMRLPERSLAEELTDSLALQAYGDDTPGAGAWVDRRLGELRVAKEGAEDDGIRARCDKYEATASRLRKKKEASVPRMSLSKHADGIRETISAPRPKVAGPPKLYDQYYIHPESIRGYLLCDVRSRCNIMEYNNSLPIFIPKRCTDESKLFYLDAERTMLKSFKQQAQPITEFFEREINRTLVQQMRRYSGIEMPEYYQKHKENAYRFVLSGERRVYLNACDANGRLKRLRIGDAYYAYNAMCEQYERYHMRDRMGDAFLKEWFDLFHFRNGVSHEDSYPDEFFGYEEFSYFHSVAMSVFKNSLWRMESIGEALRNGGPLPEGEPEHGIFSRDE